MDLQTAIRIVDKYIQDSSKSSTFVKNDDTLHVAIEACSVLVGRFKAIAYGNVQDALYSSYPEVGFTFNSFYNETVGYILRGEKRTTALSSWYTILAHYINGIRSTNKPADFGSLGANIMNATFGKSGVVPTLGDSLQRTTVNTELLSYADHEVLALWLRRVNGFSDMINSISIFLKIARP